MIIFKYICVSFNIKWIIVNIIRTTITKNKKKKKKVVESIYKQERERERSMSNIVKDQMAWYAWQNINYYFYFTL
jgi:hypothetical protein